MFSDISEFNLASKPKHDCSVDIHCPWRKCSFTGGHQELDVRSNSEPWRDGDVVEQFDGVVVTNGQQDRSKILDRIGIRNMRIPNIQESPHVAALHVKSM